LDFLIIVGATLPGFFLAGRFVFQNREEVVEEIIDGKLKTYVSHAKPLSVWHG
jgi:hypothetical protein